MPVVRAKNIVFHGRFWISYLFARREKHRPVPKEMVEWAGFPNVHDLSEIGAHPRMWDEISGDWENRNIQFALPQSGPPGGPLYWGSDFVALIF